VGGTPNLEVLGTPPPCPSPARGEGTLRPASRSASSIEHPLRVVGRLRPNSRANADIEKGLAAVARLAAFDTGHAVVVARAYILAIAAAETTLAMLARTGALRQWGIGAGRRVGVLVCRVGTQDGEEAAPPAGLLDRAAANGLAGVAVTGPPAALARFADAAGVADRLGIFLLACGERP
jgi:UDP-2,3-diacylglucosamine hydrolase